MNNEQKKWFSSGFWFLFAGAMTSHFAIRELWILFSLSLVFSILLFVNRYVELSLEEGG